MVVTGLETIQILRVMFRVAALDKALLFHLLLDPHCLKQRVTQIMNFTN